MKRDRKSDRWAPTEKQNAVSKSLGRHTIAKAVSENPGSEIKTSGRKRRELTSKKKHVMISLLC